MELIKFIGRLFGYKRYKVFIAIDNECWRQYKAEGEKGFISFKTARKWADELKKDSLSWGVEDECFVVATDRDAERLYEVQ